MGSFFDETFFSFMAVAIVVGVLVGIIKANIENSPRMVALRKQQAAEQAYKDALDVLKSTETADARIKALEAGREYVRICRKGGKETIFDEIALQNDLSAYGA